MGPATNKDNTKTSACLAPLSHGDMMVCMWFGDTYNMCLSHEVMQEWEEICADKDSRC